MFVQVHTITGYAGALLNRDDTGTAKRLTYGGAVRTRTSSQFAKRKIRMADGEHSLRSTKLGVSVRSRETFKREIHVPVGMRGDQHPAAARDQLSPEPRRQVREGQYPRVGHGGRGRNA